TPICSRQSPSSVSAVTPPQPRFAHGGVQLAIHLRLDSDWTPGDGAAGTVALTLTNLSARPLAGFRLAFTFHHGFDPHRPLESASLVARIGDHPGVAPPAGFVLAPGAAWSFSGASSGLQHYTAGLRSAYLILDDQTTVPIATTPTRRHG